MQKESKNLEYKETISKTYLKTVSAYANYNDGEIIFGISDNFKILGIEKPVDECLNIENQINDSIKPRPDYTLKVNENNTISLFVKQGRNTPYKYNGKAYKRSDSSTVEIDLLEEKRLILSGMNMSYEEISIGEANLEFDYLGKCLVEELDLSSFNLDTLKILSLYNSQTGYNNAALLLSDTNNFAGIDIAVFGNSINIFRKRVSLEGSSILKQYHDALNLFKEEYIIEKIEGAYRKIVELVPYEAFREAVANALVHRTWDIKANTKIEMHPDKIIISSPGGLVADMTREDYINGNYSYLRNPIIANVFRRLNIIEAFATGIKRINDAYKDSIAKPIYNVTSGAISVTLPIKSSIILSSNEKIVYDLMKQNILYNRVELEGMSGFTKDTMIRVLNSLVKKGIIEKNGKARSTIYIKK